MYLRKAQILVLQYFGDMKHNVETSDAFCQGRKGDEPH